MPKQISSYLPVKLISVVKLSEETSEAWKWRKEYIGAIGKLDIFESINKSPGSNFAYFDSPQTGYLKTNYGKCNINGRIITFTTPKSIYQFEIQQ